MDHDKTVSHVIPPTLLFSPSFSLSLSLSLSCLCNFNVPWCGGASPQLKRGTAELFGTELAIDKTYRCLNRKCAIFSFQGCDVQVDGIPTVAYISEETPMVAYANTHAALETKRTAVSAVTAGSTPTPALVSSSSTTTTAPSSSSSSAAAAAAGGGAVSSAPASALAAGRYGPRVMIVGATDSGKSTLASILCNYALRAQRTPIYVDVDVGQNALAPPGCVAACQLQV